MSTNPSQYPQPGTQKKTSPIVWVLAIAGVVVMLGLVAVMGIGFFVAHKIKQAGLDTESMKRNPVVATIKVMAALNPNIEIVTLDEEKGYVTVHDRKSGRTFNVNFDDAKRGRFTVEEDGKAPVTITTSGDGTNGRVEVNTGDANVKIGAQGAKVPTWVPDYPHSDPEGAFTGHTRTSDAGTYGFKTKDSVSKVIAFYEDGFRSEGMQIENRAPNVIAASATNDQNNAVVVVAAEGGETSVLVTFGSKK
jgi:uncharacterized protein YneF (UPF0154 family)